MIYKYWALKNLKGTFSNDHYIKRYFLIIKINVWRIYEETHELNHCDSNVESLGNNWNKKLEKR